MSTIHLVSHTHWDREWYHTFQEFRLKLVHLIDCLLEILETEPDFHSFLLDGQTILLEDYLELRQDRAELLLRLIKSGRILIGPWYVSPDEYLVSPESHIRNLLEGDRLCKQYGVKMLVGYLPDTFGHVGQMPQILQGFGIDSACLWRGLDEEPCELNWSAPDGSRVLLSYLRDSYSNAANLSLQDHTEFIKQINEYSHSLSDHSATGQILLMHGTDHMEPLPELSIAIAAYTSQFPELPLVHTNLPAYFSAVRDQIATRGIEIPNISGELRSSRHSPLLQNVLSSRIGLKQCNHSSETELLHWVEPLSAWAARLEATPTLSSSTRNTHNLYLKEQGSVISHSWRLLMQCHPHDSICGTSIDQVAQEMKVRFDQVSQINHGLIDQNLDFICSNINTELTSDVTSQQSSTHIISAVIVFNPHDRPSSELVDLKLTLDKHYRSLALVDDQNTLLPYHQKGFGVNELINMKLDKKGLKQALGMIHDGVVAGMQIRAFEIKTVENIATIRVTLSVHGQVDQNNWALWMSNVASALANPEIEQFVILAYSDPEVDLTFVARDVPTHGYRCYWLRGEIAPQAGALQPSSIPPIIQRLLPLLNPISRLPIISGIVNRKIQRRLPKRDWIENDYFVVKSVAPEGTLTITDKRNQQVFTGLNRFVDNGDRGDLYNYCPPEHDAILRARRMSVEAEANVCFQKLTVHYELILPKSLLEDRKSRSTDKVPCQVSSTILVVNGVPRVDIHTEIDNQVSDHRLQVQFPAPFSCSTAVYDGHFEQVQRAVELPKWDQTWEEPPRPEVPQRDFTLVVNANTSLTIANRGLPEVSVTKNESGNAEISLTLLRSIGWLSLDNLSTRKGHAGPMGISTPSAQMIGKYSFDYSIIPGDQNINLSMDQARSFCSPLKSKNEPIHLGRLPHRCSFIEHTHSDFLITTIKLSQDHSGLVVRGYNQSSSTIDVTVKPYKPYRQVYRVNLAEDPIETIPISSTGEVNFSASAHQIVTLMLKD